MPEMRIPDTTSQQGLVALDTDQVRRLLALDQAILLDARHPDEYDKGHLPDAINVPYENLNEVETILGGLARDKWLICHCDGPPCDLGELLGLELLARGAAHVAVYSGGLDAWRESGGEILKNSD